MKSPQTPASRTVESGQPQEGTGRKYTGTRWIRSAKYRESSNQHQGTGKQLHTAGRRNVTSKPLRASAHRCRFPSTPSRARLPQETMLSNPRPREINAQSFAFLEAWVAPAISPAATFVFTWAA